MSPDGQQTSDGTRPLHRCLSTNVLWIRNWRTLLHMRRADAPCALTRWQHLSAWNDDITAILKVTSEIRFPHSTRIYSKNNCQISSRSDLKIRSHGIFWSDHPKKNKK